MGHIATVNQRTLPPSINQGFLAVTGSMGKRWYKTIADLFADALSTRPGDPVFFQLTNQAPDGGPIHLADYLSYVSLKDDPEAPDEDHGFTGLMEVTGQPFFDPTPIGDDAYVPESIPIRLPVSCSHYLPHPVSEERALTHESETTELWNPKYKKALQGSKSLTSITPEEVEQLRSLLYKHNDREHEVSQESYEGDDSAKISVDARLDQRASGPEIRSSPPESIECLSLDEIPIVKGDEFRVEKTLEAWLMEMIDSDHEGIRTVFGPTDELSWFTNYVPYGISGKNMDGLAFHERDGILYRISTIELKKGRVGTSAVRQVMRYARWVTSYLGGGDRQVVQPVLIGNRFSKDAIEAARSQLSPRPPMLVSYAIEGGECHLHVEAGGRDRM